MTTCGSMERCLAAATLLLLSSACSRQTESQALCEDYVRVYAEVAATTCGRGDFESNRQAFRSATRVGQECELVASIRDPAALEGACFSWLRETVGSDCALLDNPTRFEGELPDACRDQLQIVR